MLKFLLVFSKLEFLNLFFFRSENYWNKIIRKVISSEIDKTLFYKNLTNYYIPLAKSVLGDIFFFDFLDSNNKINFFFNLFRIHMWTIFI